MDLLSFAFALARDQRLFFVAPKAFFTFVTADFLSRRCQPVQRGRFLSVGLLLWWQMMVAIPFLLPN